MYAAFVTMKDLKCYSNGIQIESVSPMGCGLNKFDPKYPKLRITYDTISSHDHPLYKTVEVNLSDVWIIGSNYFGNEPYIYEDNVGVNHPNAIKALKQMKQKIISIEKYTDNFEEIKYLVHLRRKGEQLTTNHLFTKEELVIMRDEIDLVLKGD